MTERLEMNITFVLLMSLLLVTTTALANDFMAVICAGKSPHHLQGVCTDEKEAIFRCDTTNLMKRDRCHQSL